MARLNGPLVKKLRLGLRKPFTQGELGRRARCTRQQVTMIENETAGASLEVAARIAKALGVSLDFLLIDTDDTEAPQDAEPAASARS